MEQPVRSVFEGGKEMPRSGGYRRLVKALDLWSREGRRTIAQDADAADRAAAEVAQAAARERAAAAEAAAPG